MNRAALEDSVSSLLRYGVLLCGAFIAGGVLSAFVSGDRTVFATATAALRGAVMPRSLLQPIDLLRADGGPTSPEGWVTIGLALLIALPVIRVAWLVIAFARTGERRLSLLAGLVLLLLVGGLCVGAAH